MADQTRIALTLNAKTARDLRVRCAEQGIRPSEFVEPLIVEALKKEPSGLERARARARGWKSKR